MPGVTTAYQNGIHSARPAASAGCILYACSTHSLIYRSDGSTWTTWMTIGSTTTTVASDAIWDAAGDLALGTGADTAAKLSIGGAGKVLQSDGSTAAWKYPPGYEFDYAQFTSPVNLTATTEATANTIVTANAVTYDGSQIVLIEFSCPYLTPNSSGNALVQLPLYDGSSSTGIMGLMTQAYTSNVERQIVTAQYRLMPSAAAHTYSIRGYTSTGTATAGAGAGGNGNYMPGFIRQTKVSGGA